MGHSNLVEEHVPVVHRSVTILRADVPDRDAMQWFVGAHVADLNDERVRPVVDKLFGVFCLGNQELCDDDGMVCGAAEGSIPLFLVSACLVRHRHRNVFTYPFASGESRTVDDKLLSLRYPASLTFDASDI